MKPLYFFILLLSIFNTNQHFGQGIDEYSGGYKINFNEDGSKYLRIIAWGQFWAQYNDNVPSDQGKLDFSVRRARVLTYTQLNKKFMILTHFGLNSLNANNITPTGQGSSSQLFFHDFWGEWKLADNHAAGFGLHYWNGISRANNQSTLNMLTLDNNRQSWATLGLSDQFARHIGVYAKGKWGRLQYRIAVNEANTSTLDNRDPELDKVTVYGGRRILGSADSGKVFQGYFDYHFFDQESNFLPYKVGTYLGSKKVFNIGAGFFSHPNGSIRPTVNSIAPNPVAVDVNIFAVDAFYDAPLGGNNNAITAYAVYQNNDYGDDYNFRSVYLTGEMFYAHLGYLIGGEKTKTRLQPYASFNYNDAELINSDTRRIGVGGNIFMTGHHSKISIEYSSSKVGNAESNGLVTVQAMIFL